MRKTSENRMAEFLSILEAASTAGFVSGEVLAKRTEASRSAIWKQIHQLRRYGYRIESVRGLGYRLVDKTTMPVPWELKRLLNTRIIGSEIVYRESGDSTQDIALAIAAKLPEANGTVVILENQRSGRGRLKRRWVSPRGGLWLSVLLRPQVETSAITILPLVAALAVRDAIAENKLLKASLKWPNDIMISSKKVAGILLDVSAEAETINYVVFGIGINANVDSKELAAKVGGTHEITSLKDELGREVDNLELAAAVLQNLERHMDTLLSRGAEQVISAWKSNTDMLGKKISVLQNGKKIGEGIAADVDTDGALIVRSESGKKSRITSGDLQIRT